MYFQNKYSKIGNSLAVQWLGLCVFTAKGATLVGELRSLQTAWCSQKQNKTKQTPSKQKLHMCITVKYIPYKTFLPKWKHQKGNKDETFKVNHKFVF